MESQSQNRRLNSCDTVDASGMNCKSAAYISEKAAEAAVQKVFAILGVDINKPESVEEFREDLRFGKRLRKLSDHGSLSLVGLFFTGLGALVVLGIKKFLES